MLPDEANRHAVEVVENFADKQARKQDLKSAQAAASTIALDPDYNPVLKATGVNASTAALWSSHDAVALVGKYTPEGVTRNAYSRSAEDSENRVQCDLLRCIVGNPFQSLPPVPPALPSWNDGTVRRIAEGIYAERRLPEGTLDSGRLAILPDALLEAGCDNEELIAHCRSPGPHVRGCWAIDQILEKT